MKKVFLKRTAVLAAALVLVACAVGISACDNENSDKKDDAVYTPNTGSSGTGGSGGSGASGGSTSSKTVTTVFVKMDAGTFQMGCSAGESNETVHSVTLTRDFYICDHEVTQAEFQAVMGSNPSYHWGDESVPVDQVCWNEAIVYCNKRSMAEGRTPCYSIGGNTDPAAWGPIPIAGGSNVWLDAVTCNFDANGYRLPTEAEWEYAARAGDTTTDARTWSGTTAESSLGSYAWYSENSGSTTRPVKDKQPNAKGLYDMSGNVSEWCWDWYDSYGSGAVTDPTGPSSGSKHVRRGGDYGDYLYNAASCSVSYRAYDSAHYWNREIGFRVCYTGN